MEKKEHILPFVLLLLFTILFVPKGIAGGRVVYLKNGTILFCRDYRHVRGEDYWHVQIGRDAEIHVPDEDVLMTGIIHRHALPDYQLDYKYDSLSHTYVKLPNYYKHEHGFFFQGQISVIMIDGIRLMAGYRFNTYIALCLGIGAEYGATLSEPDNNYTPSNPGFAASYVYNSGYSPFFLHITGDILKSKVTPFYSLEIGYDLPWYRHLQTNPDDGANPGPYSYYTNYGGPTAGLGLGCRFYSRKRTNISLSVNMNEGYVKIKTYGLVNDGYTYPYTPVYVTTAAKYIMTQPSFRFSVGF